MELETQRVYDAILDYWMAYALPPSLDDLARELGMSKTGIAYQVKKLRELHKITTRAGVRRSIQPIGMTIVMPEENAGPTGLPGLLPKEEIHP